MGRRWWRTPAEAATFRRQRVLAASAKMQAALSVPSSPRGASLSPSAAKVRQALTLCSAAASSQAQPACQLVPWLTWGQACAVLLSWFVPARRRCRPVRSLHFPTASCIHPAALRCSMTSRPTICLLTVMTNCCMNLLAYRLWSSATY